MGRVHVSRVIRARIGYFAGVGLIAAGLLLTLGLGWALVAAGVGVAASFVWLYDVDTPPDPTLMRRSEEDW